MKKRYSIQMMILFSLLLCLVSGGLALAQRPGGPRGGQNRDPLAGLKRVLSNADAAPLTAAQEEQLNTLITARRESLQSQGPSAALQSASQAYDRAILNGDISAAQAQADLIANEMATATRARLKESAKFEIDFFNVLRSNSGQFSQLSAHLGSVGLSRLLHSLAGGPGGFPGESMRGMGGRMGAPGKVAPR